MELIKSMLDWVGPVGYRLSVLLKGLRVDGLAAFNYLNDNQRTTPIKSSLLVFKHLCE